MDWFGKSTKVEGKNELESIGIRFQPIEFHPDRNEYELRIQLPGCPRELVKLIYDKPSGKLQLQGKKRSAEFVHHFPVPTDCLATGIYGRFRGDVLRIIMPRLLESPPSAAASSKHDQNASYEPEATKQVGKDREKLPARLPESSRSDRTSTDKLREGGGKDRDKLPARLPESKPSDQKSTDKLREGGGKDPKKLPARFPEPSPSDQKSTDKSREGGRKDRDKLPAGVLPPPPPDQETTEKLRQRDNELFPEITASQPSVRELRENYQKNISQNADKLPPPPPPPPSRGTAPAPWNRIKDEIISRKEEKKVDKNAKIVAESEAKEKREEKKPSGGGKGALWVVTKVKETGKAAVGAAMKKENRSVVLIGAAVLAVMVIGASWRSSSKKTKN